MNSKSTWNWIIVAAVLFAGIFLLNQFRTPAETGPEKALPQLKPTEVTSVLVRPAGLQPIQAVRTNDTWQLAEPVDYPAQAAAVERLLDALTQLTPAPYISPRELRKKHNFDDEYGFTSPQASITIQQGAERIPILIGARTSPGDQVFLEVVGGEGVFVVSADFLQFVPRLPEAWRDTTLVRLSDQTFDRLTITNGAQVVELRRNSTNDFWSMARPIPTRANNGLIAELLQRLQALHVIQFVTDNPQADLDNYGLNSPDLILALAQGTNSVSQLEFGRSPTNSTGLVYAHRAGYGAIVTVSNALLTPWRASVKDFRDPRLVNFANPVARIEVLGKDGFTVQRQDDNTWKITKETFPVDPALMKDFVTTLAKMQIVQYKDAVTESDLPTYGLTNPVRQIVIQTAPDQGASATNGVTVQLSFGSSQDGKLIFVRRSDEDSVYAVKLADFQRLPSVAWQLRERQLWHFTEKDVAKLVIHDGDRVRELLRDGTNSWSLATQGILDDVQKAAIEETVHRLGDLAAGVWVDRRDSVSGIYGFSTNNFSLQLELKNGEKRSVEFGGMAPSHYPFAAVELDGQKWVFEFPLALYELVQTYLTIPAKVP